MDYEKYLSQKAKSIKPSGIRQFFELVQNNKQNVLSLGVGEPDFDTPFSGKEGLQNALRHNYTHYTSNQGLLQLRNAVAKYYDTRFNLKYSAEEEILICCGTSEALDLICRALINPEDEVLIPSPSYVAYAPCVELCGGIAKKITCSFFDGFAIDCNGLEKQITSKTKAIVLPYPNNPTGATIPRTQLEQLCKIIVAHDLFVISDEIYNELYFAKEPFCSPATLPHMKERTAVINGFSKSLAMTGWRIGYVLAPKRITEIMTGIHQHTAICASTLSQYAALAVMEQCLEDDFSVVKQMLAEYSARRFYVASQLDSLNLPYVMPNGAFYFFPDVSSLGMDGNEFAVKLLKEYKVAVVPGDAFGDTGKNNIRLSYACSLDVLTKAFQRIGEFVQSVRSKKS